MDRKARIEAIESKLADKKLMWIGNRSTDAECFSDFNALEYVITTIAPYNKNNNYTEYCLENTTNKRVDLNNYNIDNDNSSELNAIYNKLLTIQKNVIIIPYAPSKFLTSLFFSRSGIEYWSMFFLKQYSYTYKPWVESELTKKHKINDVGWRYFNDGNFSEFMDFAGNESTVLRVSQGSGGAGMILADNPNDALKFSENNRDGFFSASKYKSKGVSVSINAVLHPKEIRMFHPSIQLIGIQEATNRPLGFCGSDYGAAKNIPDSLWNESEDIINKIGKWLRFTGYLGAFGVDLLFDNNDVYFIELNPRFTASSISSSKISKNMNEIDIYLEHMSAYCEVGYAPYLSLKDQVKEQSSVSELIVYNKTKNNIKRMGNFEPNDENYIISELPNKSVAVEPNAQLFKISFEKSITDDGKCLHENISELINKNIKLWKTGNLD